VELAAATTAKEAAMVKKKAKAGSRRAERGASGAGGSREGDAALAEAEKKPVEVAVN
jgi:hypothetical protein